MIRVAVTGVTGKMGAEVCRAVLGAPDCELVAAIGRSAAGRPVSEVARAASELVVAPGIEEASRAGAQVVVDFTTASAAAANLAWCAEAGIHAVCGTTGLDPEALARLALLYEAPGAPNALVAANFAISAVLLFRLAELAAPFFEGIEVVELHHEAKSDAPSGTALETARRMAEARVARGSGPLVADPTTKEVLGGSRGAVGPGGVRIHAIRLPGLVAHEEVLFGALGQSLTIRQDSYDRRSFMPGVLLAIRQVPVRSGFTLGLEALLGL